jgi:hypothetical protein
MEGVRKNAAVRMVAGGHRELKGGWPWGKERRSLRLPTRSQTGAQGEDGEGGEEAPRSEACDAQERLTVRKSALFQVLRFGPYYTSTTFIL